MKEKNVIKEKAMVALVLAREQLQEGAAPDPMRALGNVLKVGAEASSHDLRLGIRKIPEGDKALDVLNSVCQQNWECADIAALEKAHIQTAFAEAWLKLSAEE